VATTVELDGKIEGARLGKTEGGPVGSKLGVLEGGALGATVGASVVGSMLGGRDRADEGIKLGVRDKAGVVALHSALVILRQAYAHPLQRHSGARRAGHTMEQLRLVRRLKMAK
jgi:hypothetical protein